MSDKSSDSINLLDILSFLVRTRKVWLPSMLVCAVAIGIYAFVATPQFRSAAIVRGVENKSSSFGSMLASKLAGLGNLGGFSGGLGEVRGEYYLMLMRERSMSTKVVEKFDLRTKLKLPDAPIEDVIDAWRSHVYLEYEGTTSTILIQVDDADPEFAKQVVEFYISELDKRMRELESTKARKEREFAESRLDEARTNLYSLEDSMSSFQRNTGIFDLEEQAKATVQAAAAVEAQRLLARAEYDLKKKIFAGDNPELNLAKLKLAGLDSSLAYLTSEKEDPAERDFLLRIDSATEDGKTYLRLYRDIELHSIMVAVLTQQYEQARMDEARNTPTMAIVEPPSVGTKRVAPKRTMLVALGALIGLMFGLVYASFAELVRAMSVPGNPNHDKYLALRRSWRGR
ncbi:MAG: hypothetical protein KDB65_04735 [Calditrichaeota bacterium]|nr:hypothetical protein [Calditrichota bacterium]MCB9368374.1 hypothetical protein [Calditrichota bacterium]